MRFLVKIAPHSLPNRNHFRIVCNSSQPDCFAHSPHPSVFTAFFKTLCVFRTRQSQPQKGADAPRSTRTPCLRAERSASRPFCATFSKQRNSQKQLPDELAQNIAGRRHDSARVRIAEQAFDTQML